MSEIGFTQSFVLAQGFRQQTGYVALVGVDGTERLFAELTADADRPEVRPQEAYRALLSSMQPGWSVRLLQIFWPDPVPRNVFSMQVSGSGRGGRERGEGFDLLHQGLNLFLQEAPLPFVRHMVLEFVSSGEEGMAWWKGMTGLLQGYGLQARSLTQDEIQGLARRVFNPEV